MTNKTEDKFYFGKPGQPERFMRDIPVKSWKKGAEDYEAGITEDSGQFQPYVNMPKSGTLVTRNAPTFKSEAGARKWLSEYLTKQGFSRPGQPERFGLEDACWEGYEPVGTKQKDGRTVPNCVPKDENAGPERFAASGWQTIEAYMQVLAEEFGTPRGKEAAQVMMRAAESLGGNAPAALRTAIRTAATSKNATDRGRAIGQIEDMLESASFSRPGQPDKFDASSLDRGNFAEASTSPMLGKLLAAKVMPEGGWRAVQVGSDTLVISFEDADLASDFGRRVATKGYNATSPVQAIGRYWNVEVKNDGK